MTLCWELVTLCYELITLCYELITQCYELITRFYELIAQNYCDSYSSGPVTDATEHLPAMLTLSNSCWSATLNHCRRQGLQRHGWRRAGWTIGEAYNS